MLIYILILRPTKVVFFCLQVNNSDITFPGIMYSIKIMELPVSQYICTFHVQSISISNVVSIFHY